MLVFEKTKNYNIKLGKTVLTACAKHGYTFSYAAYDKRLKYLKSLIAQFTANGYIALSPYNISHDKRPIRELINNRINRFLPYEQWKGTNKKALAWERTLLYLTSNGNKWSTLEKYERQVNDHYNNSDQPMDLNKFSNEYLITFNRVRRRGL